MIQLSEKRKWPAGERSGKPEGGTTAGLVPETQPFILAAPALNLAPTRASSPAAGYWAFDGRKNMYAPFTELVPNDELTDEVSAVACCAVLCRLSSGWGGPG